MKAIRFNFFGAVLVAFLLFLGPTALQSQQITGTILGSVSDSSGAALPNAQISITNQDTGVTRATISGADGLYNMPEVGAGTYTVAATATGFSPAAVKDVVVTVGTDTRVNLKMQVGSVSQSVTVTEAAPLVETTSSAVGSTVEQQKVADLPLNGRNWTDLTLLQPGVTQIKTMTGTAADAGFNGLFYSSNGAPMFSNAILLDGANEKNIEGANNSSLLNTSLGVDGIQEYKVVTSLFSAEYGMSMGSQTTVVSKGGTNQWHGDAYEYLRNASLDARNYFDVLDTLNANGFGTNKSIVYPGKRIPPFRRNDFGGSGGGPIKKDKTFIYAVYEGIRLTTGVTTNKTTLPIACFTDQNGVVQRKVPAQILNPAMSNGKGACNNATPGVVTVPAQLLPYIDLFPQPLPGLVAAGYSFNYTIQNLQPGSEDFGQIRIDQNFSASDSLFGRYTDDRSAETVIYTWQPYLNLLSSGSQFTTVGENHIFTPTLLNSIRFSVSRTTPSVVGAENQNAPLPPGSLTLVPGQLMGGFGPGTGPSGAVSGIGVDSSNNKKFFQNIYTLSDDVFWTKGKHGFKFGALVNYFYADITSAQFAQGGVGFSNFNNFFNQDWSSITVETSGGFDPTDFRWITSGFYGQDDYRLSNRLTLNLGLRYEFATVPIESNSALAYSIRDAVNDTAGVPGRFFQNDTWHNFSPRIGFAWDVTGKGKTAIRGGAGIYYDIGNYGGLIKNYGISTPPEFALTTITSTGSTPPFPLVLPLNIPAIVAEPGNALLVRGVDYNNFHQPTLLQHSLSIEQQLPWDMGLSVAYVGSRGWHLLQEVERNPVQSIGADSRGLPTYGCWAKSVNGAAHSAPSAATGECPTTQELTGPRLNPDPLFGGVEFSQNTGDSYYNALQIQLSKRASHGLQFQFAYTLSKLIDDGQQENPTQGTENNQSPTVSFDDRGPSVFDAPQNVRFNMIYHVPTVSSQGALGKLANGWWISSVVSAQSGYPFNPVLGSDRELQNFPGGYGWIERPSLAPGFDAHKDILGKVSEWFDPTEFALQPSGTLGNAGRNDLRGPGFEDVDFSLVKDTKVGFLGEAGSVEFRAEFFNLLNRANFSNPGTTVYTSTLSSITQVPSGQIQAVGSGGVLAAPVGAGAITSTIGTSRQIQLALKVLF